jgi:hypothetical protein|tara:strand:- start:653 stop:868 length:216 start_codon:yes stop_codon:yes gene_type:complete
MGEEQEQLATLDDILEVIERRHKTMVRRVLEQVEAALPDGRQQKMFKKHIQIPLYDFKEDLSEILRAVGTK